jgi:hypothetical protein
MCCAGPTAIALNAQVLWDADQDTDGSGAFSWRGCEQITEPGIIRIPGSNDQ